MITTFFDFLEEGTYFVKVKITMNLLVAFLISFWVPLYKLLNISNSQDIDIIYSIYFGFTNYLFWISIVKTIFVFVLLTFILPWIQFQIYIHVTNKYKNRKQNIDEDSAFVESKWPSEYIQIKKGYKSKEKQDTLLNSLSHIKYGNTYLEAWKLIKKSQDGEFQRTAKGEWVLRKQIDEREQSLTEEANLIPY